MQTIQGQVYHGRRVCTAQGPKRIALSETPPSIRAKSSVLARTQTRINQTALPVNQAYVPQFYIKKKGGGEAHQKYNRAHQ